MALSKLTILIFLFNITSIKQVTTQCSNPFSTGNDTNLCYYYNDNALSWIDAYNQCLTKTFDGILIQIFSIEQFNSLKNANIDQTSPFWLGANNFASFYNSNWHWLDGTVVDDSVITWCSNSTYITAIGTQCAAYDSTLQCVNNYLCNSLLPAPCVSATNGIHPQAKISITSRDTSTYICLSSSGGAYANWWTYSVLLINWFILFCFFLYLCNRFILTKNTILLTAGIAILSFVMMIVFAILWGVQYQNIIQIPLAVVILGCLADVFLLIVVFIVLNDRTRVRQFIACMALLIVTLILECCLMLGLILCVAYCSGYITLASTDIEKDVIASLLASLIAFISILLYTGILYLLDNTGQDRVHVLKPGSTNVMPVTTTQAVAPPRLSQNNNHRPTQVGPFRKKEQIDRATSPVDDRILNEFYTSRPKDVHQYTLDGRQYVVYEGADLTDIETYRNELTQAMLTQEPQGLREAIDHAKNSIHALTLADDIRQAQGLATKLVQT